MPPPLRRRRVGGRASAAGAAFLPLLPAAAAAALAAAAAAVAEAGARAGAAGSLISASVRRARGDGFLVRAAGDGRRLHVVYRGGARGAAAAAEARGAAAAAEAEAGVGTWGEGVCVVFEAGACCSGSVWEAAGALLEATGARVLRYDRAGFGGSEADLRDERGVGEAGKDLVAAVRNSGARPPYVLVAHSLGALFVDAALRDGGLPRDDVLGVVYVDPASLDGVRGLRRFVPKRSPPRWAARLLGGLGVLRLAMPRVLAVYYDAFGGAGPRVRGEAVENWARGDWLVSYTREWAAALAFAGEGAAAGEALPVRRAARYAEAADGGAYGPGWLGDLPIAVIVPDVYERTRGMQYVGDIQRRVARYSTDAELFEPADCGHFVQIEQPEQVAAAVRSVVRRARVRRARAGALERRRPGSAAGGRGAAVDGDADGGGSARP